MPLFGALAAILVGIVGADAVYTDKLPAAATCNALRATMISTLISAAEIWRRPASRELDDFARRCTVDDPDALSFAALLTPPFEPAPVTATPRRAAAEPAPDPAAAGRSVPPPASLAAAPVPRPRPVALATDVRAPEDQTASLPPRVAPEDGRIGLGPSHSPIRSPNVVLYMGLGGNLFADNLKHLGGELQRCGANITIREWFMPSPRKFDVALGHSAGTWTLDKTDAPIKIALDPTIRFSPKQPVSRSYYTDGIGIRVPNTANIYVPHVGHVAIPRAVEADVVDYVFRGRCRVQEAATGQARAPSSFDRTDL